MSLQNEYHALRKTAGLVDRSSRGRLVVAGADRRTYLQGLLTNDIAALAEGTGCYSAYLTPQGRMIADMRVFETGRHLLVDLNGSLAEMVAARWSQFVFSEDVQIANESASTAEVGVYGPSASSIVARALAGNRPDGSRELEETIRALPLYANRLWDLAGGSACVLVSDDIGMRGFDIVVPFELKQDLVASLERAGGIQVGAEAAEVCRVEGGRPLFGVDMNDDTIPLEAGIEDRAISLTKGCYVGQEVIIRVLHRGHGRVARRLVGIAFEHGGPVPSPGDRIASSGRDIGVITSAIESPALGKAIALGYVHRDYAEHGTPVDVKAQIGKVEALPFVPISTEPARVVAE
jgi:folate-binding protein YgfZ